MQERALKTRGRILRTSKRLFAGYGFHGTSVDRIAAEAKANKQRIYEYFSSKRGLFEACLKSSYEDAGREEEIMLGKIGGDCAGMTEVILGHYMELHRKHPEFWRLISWANLEPDHAYKWLKNVKDESYRKLGALYRKGQEAEVFSRDVSFEAYMFMLFAVTFFYHSNRRTLANTLDPKLFTPDGAARIVRDCARMICGAAKAGG